MIQPPDGLTHCQRLEWFEQNMIAVHDNLPDDVVDAVDMMEPMVTCPYCGEEVEAVREGHIHGYWCGCGWMYEDCLEDI